MGLLPETPYLDLKRNLFDTQARHQGLSNVCPFRCLVIDSFVLAETDIHLIVLDV